MVGGRPNEDRAMHRFAIAAAGFALSLAAALAFASEPPAAATARADRCAPVPRAQFKPEADLAAVVEGFGYQVVRVGTDAGCYAVLASDRRGKRYDMRFEGANLRMVSRYIAQRQPEVVAQR
jgi:hypothetical protein